MLAWRCTATAAALLLGDGLLLAAPPRPAAFASMNRATERAGALGDNALPP